MMYVCMLQLNMHTPYVCGFAWSDIVHGCMVYTERAKMAAVSCQHCKYATLVDIKKNKKRYEKLFTHVESHVSAVSLLKSGE